jgi:G2/mitotic-specific cyclin-B, other
MTESIHGVLQTRKREPLSELNFENFSAPEVILQQMLLNKQEYLENPLENHSIHPSLRARMVDWMIEIITSFSLKHRTYFLAVNIMDMFLKNTHKEFNNKSMHLIGVACMIIASKFNDSRHITVEAAHRYISSGELKDHEIIAMEAEIVKTVNNYIGMVTTYDVISVLCEKYKASNKVKRTSLTILYLIQMYYDSLKFSVNVQAFCAFLISLHTLGCKNILEEISYHGDCIVDMKVLHTLLSGIKNFSSSFPNFLNPTRFLAFEFSQDQGGELFVFKNSNRFD